MFLRARLQHKLYRGADRSAGIAAPYLFRKCS
jgi:hypothetical protein